MPNNTLKLTPNETTALAAGVELARTISLITTDINKLALQITGIAIALASSDAGRAPQVLKRVSDLLADASLALHSAGGH